MNIEIENFIAEVKKTRDFSAFVTANPKKTSKQAETSKQNVQPEVEATPHEEPLLDKLLGKEDNVINTMPESVDNRSHQTELKIKQNMESSDIPNPFGTEGPPKLLKQEKIETIEDIEVKAVKADKPLLPVKTVKPTQSKYTPFKISQEFINYVQGYQVQESSDVKNIKRVILGEDLHEQLMHLKHRTKVKSVSAIVNVILADFMNNNKLELEGLFSEPTNRIKL
jgi:hypothetical protein